jgi:hypothetical protein
LNISDFGDEKKFFRMTNNSNWILEEQQCCFDPGGLGKMGRALAIVYQVLVSDIWISNVVVGQGCSSFDEKNTLKMISSRGFSLLILAQVLVTRH